MKWIFLFLLPLVGCAGIPGDFCMDRSAGSGLITKQEFQDSVDASVTPDTSTAKVPEGGTKRKIIYKGKFTLLVLNRDLAAKRSVALAREFGGYVQEERLERIKLRVPAKKFQAFVGRITAIGQVKERHVTADDVTENYQDLQLRLKMKEKFLTELHELYKKGGALQELLKVKQEIDRVTEEVERIKGRLRYLSDRISFSEITLVLQVITRDFSRNFNLPFPWLNDLGVENLLSH